MRRGAEVKLSEAQRIAHVGYWESDIDTDHIVCSEEAWRILGLEQRQESLTRDSVLEMIHPADRESALLMIPESLRKGTSFEAEYRLTRPTGQIRFVRVHGHLRKDESGRAPRIFGTVQDITEQKRAAEALQQSQEKYRVFFEQNLAGNYIATNAGDLLTCNPSFLKMFGFASEEEAKGTNLGSLYADQSIRNEFLKSLKEKGHLEHYEKEFRRRDGTPLYVTENAIGICNDQCELVEIHGFLVDETSRVRTEQQLRQAQKMEAIGGLAGGIAHDFNNILGVINGYSEILLREPMTDGLVRQRVQEILRAGQRAAALTSQLLAFSRKQILQPKVISLNVVVSGMSEMLHRLLGDDITVVTALQPDLEAVKADPTQMEQIILNLCINARDAMPEGGTLTITTTNVDIDETRLEHYVSMKPGRYACLTVGDTGTGMDEETMSRIFEPFFTTKEQDKGTGMGLATVYGIVKQSGGHIMAWSQLGRGATFSVYLAATVQPHEREQPSGLRYEMARGSETILLGEDNAPLRGMIRELLETTGYKVLEAEDAEHAVRMAEQDQAQIDLLLTDVSLPKMKGTLLASKLLEQRPGIKVVYISGYANVGMIQSGILNTGMGFLQKPFSPEELSQNVREVLGTVQKENLTAGSSGGD